MLFFDIVKNTKKIWNKFLTFLHSLDRASGQACGCNFWSKKGRKIV